MRAATPLNRLCANHSVNIPRKTGCFGIKNTVLRVFFAFFGAVFPTPLLRARSTAHP